VSKLCQPGFKMGHGFGKIASGNGRIFVMIPDLMPYSLNLNIKDDEHIFRCVKVKFIIAKSA